MTVLTKNQKYVNIQQVNLDDLLDLSNKKKVKVKDTREVITPTISRHTRKKNLSSKPTTLNSSLYEDDYYSTLNKENTTQKTISHNGEVITKRGEPTRIKNKKEKVDNQKDESSIKSYKEKKKNREFSKTKLDLLNLDTKTESLIGITKDLVERDYKNQLVQIQKYNEKTYNQYELLETFCKLRDTVGYTEETLTVRNIVSSFYYKQVIKLAGNYSHSYEQLESYISYGIMGLYKGLDRYDYNKGFEFLTFGKRYIQNEMIKLQSKDIGVKTCEYSRIRRLRKIIIEHGGLESITQDLDKFFYEIGEFNNLKTAKRYTATYGPLIKDLYSGKVSIDDTEYGMDTLEELQYNEETSSLNYEYEQMKNVEEASQILERIEVLTKSDERALDIIKMRFGLVGDDEVLDIIKKYNKKYNTTVDLTKYNKDKEGYTLCEIGKLLGITRERVRQIEFKVLEQLRNDTMLRDQFIIE